MKMNKIKEKKSIVHMIVLILLMKFEIMSLNAIYSYPTIWFEMILNKSIYTSV